MAAYDERLAVSAGAYSAFRSAAPLSLGDRACLALAQRERLPALTADRRWIEVEADIGVRVQLIR